MHNAAAQWEEHETSRGHGQSGHAASVSSESTTVRHPATVEGAGKLAGRALVDRARVLSMEGSGNVLRDPQGYCAMLFACAR